MNLVQLMKSLPCRVITTVLKKMSEFLRHTDTVGVYWVGNLVLMLHAQECNIFYC